MVGDVVCGDLNGHAAEWSKAEETDRGLLWAAVIEERGFFIANEDAAPTRVGNFLRGGVVQSYWSSPDVTAVSEDFEGDVDWRTVEGHHLDHIPIVIEVSFEEDAVFEVRKTKARFNFVKADWGQFVREVEVGAAELRREAARLTSL